PAPRSVARCSPRVVWRLAQDSAPALPSAQQQRPQPEPPPQRSSSPRCISSDPHKISPRQSSKSRQVRTAARVRLVHSGRYFLDERKRIDAPFLYRGLLLRAALAHCFPAYRRRGPPPLQKEEGGGPAPTLFPKRTVSKRAAAYCNVELSMTKRYFTSCFSSRSYASLIC